MLINILLVALMVIAASLIVSVLLQSKGTGVGGVFGGEGAVYRSQRGVERILHYTTIASATLMGLVSLVIVLLKK